jgi:methyl-accepting chemotaxis protein
MTQISNASEEQSIGIAQVNDAITQMDQVTQQNAALVEEAAAAAESMQEQSAKLADVVSVFKLDTSYASSAPVLSRAPARAAALPRRTPSVAAPVKRAAPAVGAAPAPVPAAQRKAVTTGESDWEEF